MIPGIVAQTAPGTAAPVGDGVVVLLMGFNGPNGSQDLRDEGKLNLPVTPLGNVSLSNLQSKFGGTSAYFDGTNDGISFPFNEGFEFGTDEFLIDGWFYTTATGTHTIVANRISGDAGDVSWAVTQISSTGNRLEFLWATGPSTSLYITSTDTFTLNAWHYFAIGRGTDGDIRMFLDGVFQGSLSSPAAVWTAQRFPVFLGILGDLTSDFSGYMDEIRIVKGDGVYQDDSDFTPPGAAFARPTQDSIVPDPDPDFDNVLLLLGFDNTSDIYLVRDGSSYDRKIAYRYNPGSYVTTTQRGLANRGTGFFSNSSGIYYEDSADWALGTDEFTVEFWVLDDFYNAFQHIIGQRNADSASNTAWVLTTLTGDGGVEFIGSNGSTLSQFASGTKTLHRNAWNHVALTRDASGVFRMFINGVMWVKDTTHPTLAIQNLASPLTIGTKTDHTNPTTAYLDEIRITRGVCRYDTDASFYPDLKPFSRDATAPPVVTLDPEITSRSGFFAVGDILDLDIGVANGFDPAIQWRRDGVNLGGATGTSYTLQALDEDAYIDATVKWWNYQGMTTATAASVGPVAAGPVYDSGALAPAGDMQDGGDRLIPDGDMQDGGDVLLWKERTT